MKEKIMQILEGHELRRRTIASFAGVWQCSKQFLAAMDELKREGKIIETSHSDPANMEYYYTYRVKRE